jgi:guanylate kinase
MIISALVVQTCIGMDVLSKSSISLYRTCTTSASRSALFSSSTFINRNVDIVTSMNTIGNSLVISGPSGVGKGTLISKIMDMYPSKLDLSVSHTSRKPRPGEIDGVHYHFIEKELLKADIERGEIKYIEHAKVHDNLYGTRLDDVEKVHRAGKICILDVDMRGVEQLKRSNFPAQYVFINPPSLAVLEQRLRSRGTESQQQVALRIHNAEREISYGLSGTQIDSSDPRHFDHILTNDRLESTIDELVAYIFMSYPDIMGK